MAKEKPKSILDEAKARAKLAVKSDAHNRDAAIADLKFINDDNGMWDEQELQRRKVSKRPVLQINQINKYLNQVKNEMRMNRPRLKVRPIDSKADVHAAKIREGIMMNIAYLSSADNIYDDAGGSAAECGYGAWRIITQDTVENPFEQEIRMVPVQNPLAIYLEPNKTPDKAKWGFFFDWYIRDDFKAEWPDADSVDFEEAKKLGVDTFWYGEDTVTVAEYYKLVPEETEYAQLSDGKVMPLEEAQALIESQQEAARILQQAAMEAMQAQMAMAQSQAQPGQAAHPPVAQGNPPPVPAAMPQMPPQVEIVKTKKMTKYNVKQWILTGKEIIEGGKEGTDIPGEFIPLIQVIGRKRFIKDKTYIKGLIRDGKDANRNFNYWYTSASERIALSPKSPWIGSKKMFQGYETDYSRANTDNLPFLKANADKDFPGMLPRREPAADIPQAMLTMLADARQNVKDAMGMYNADVGDHGKELSGAAIRQRQMPGDIGTFDIYDNLVKAIEHNFRVINSMIPEVYDTERDARLRNADDTESFSAINTTTGRALALMRQNPGKYAPKDIKRLREMVKVHGFEKKFNDITEGKYGVVITTGPTYSTQRQEAATKLMELLNTPLGQTIQHTGPDLVIKNMDFLGNDELAERVKKILPPGLVEPTPGEKPTKPLPPPPQAQLLMLKAQTEMAKQAKEKMALQVKLVQFYKETKETDISIRQQILAMLAELNAPPGQHPADKRILGGMQ